MADSGAHRARPAHAADADTPFDVPEEAVSEQLTAERLQYTRESRWTGPIGVLASAALYVALVGDAVPAGYRFTWLAAMTVLAAVTLLSNLVDIGSWTRADGIPGVTHVMHVLIGFGWGTAMWMTLDHDDTPELRWMTIAIMVAVTSGASSGLAGVNNLGRHVVIAMWITGGTALVVDGQYGLAIGLGVFVALTLHEVSIGSNLWRDLIRLRVSTRLAADRHRREAHTDSLTSLLNRTGLREHVEQLERGASVAAFYVDLDDFKVINDEWGHLAGDVVLVEVASRIGASVPADSAVARLGGDEFFVLVPTDRLDDGDDATQTEARIRSAIAEPVVLTDDRSVRVSASVGAAASSNRWELGELIDAADTAQYAAKRQARSGRRESGTPELLRHIPD